jgi:hypothetical protein
VTVLKFNPMWRFHSPGPIANGVQGEFDGLIGKVVAQIDRQRGLEHFKHYFANAIGSTSNWSSSASWAEADLYNYMTEAATNAPLFIEAFYDACVAYNDKGIAIPDVSMINAVLTTSRRKIERGWRVFGIARGAENCKVERNWS